MDKQQLAQYVEYTRLKAGTTEKEVLDLLANALKYQVKAVCLNPKWVKLAVEKLKGSGIEVATVVGFPLGANESVTKVSETITAIHQGATEIDMVACIDAIKSNDWNAVRTDIMLVTDAAHRFGAKVKVILEMCLLSDDEKRKASNICLESGTDFIKTSTGFSTGGATIEDIQLMKEVVGDKVQIKASGGVRTLEQALSLIAAGASRIGTSSLDFLDQVEQQGSVPEGETAVVSETASVSSQNPSESKSGSY